jgi:SAM-dependent methyltransferase
MKSEMNTKIFDLKAESYDFEFSDSPIGRAQRQAVHRFVKDELKLQSNLKILELNCGTGIDIAFLQTFGTVTATDASAKMVEIASERNPDVICSVLDFNQPIRLEQKYDIIFSNFGGLNCITPTRLKELSYELEQHLIPNGQLFIVLMHKWSFAEFIYFAVKLNFKKAARRLSGKAKFGELPIHYYSKSELSNIFQSFHLNKTLPIGLILSGEYMNVVGNKLQKSDQYWRWLFPLIGADHVVYNFVLKTKDQQK